MRIEYHPVLEADLESARDYYEDSSVGLGGEFVNEFEQQVQRIAAMPSRWAIVERDIRCALMKRFPHVIYFRILDRLLKPLTIQSQSFTITSRSYSSRSAIDTIRSK